MKLIDIITALAVVAASLQDNTTTPYIGGNQFNSYYTNPNVINSFLSQVTTTVSPACSPITGVGQPILAVKQFLQAVDTLLDSTNRDSSAKIIFFKEKSNNTTFQTNYKLVIMLKTFAATNYLAVEGLYKQVGFPTFEVLTYYFDSNIDNIRSVMNDYTIDPASFVGCGDVKSIYSQANPVLPKPNIIVNGQQSNPSQTPYAQGNKIINGTPQQDSGNVDPDLIAQIIKLLRKP